MRDSRKLFIGLMSGTSVDGVDAVLVDFSENKTSLLHALTYPIPENIVLDIKQLMLPSDNEIDRMGVLDQQLGDIFAAATEALLKQSNTEYTSITAIGSHGQTIRHRPKGTLSKAFTLQIADPNIIAEKTGITTVADFRRRDMAAGGQGAPLVPAFHQAVFSVDYCDRIIVNIGGIANISYLSKDKNTLGFDTGPGNALMDEWIKLRKNLPYDKNGEWASSGNVNQNLLNKLLAHEYFDQQYPKSTGREVFTLSWLEHLLTNFPNLAPENVQATLLELTAKTICSDIIELSLDDKMEVYVCGGGAHNSALMGRLKTLLPNNSVTTTSNLGIEPDWIEGAAFAWLAQQTLAKSAGNLPSVTGAEKPVILGGVYFA